jgi:hypothetical protein
MKPADLNEIIAKVLTLASNTWHCHIERTELSPHLPPILATADNSPGLAQRSSTLRTPCLKAELCA